MGNSPLLFGPNNRSTLLQNGMVNADGSPNKHNGPKNYLANPSFSTGTTAGWSLASVTLSNLVPTGTMTAIAPTITTFNIATTGTLTGSYSLQVAGSAAISAGQGFVSQAFTIDQADQAKMLTFKAAYSVTAGLANLNLSGTSANSWQIYFYDVANGAWIQPSGVYGITQGVGVGYVTGQFQTAMNTTSLQMLIVCANATAGAMTMLWDDFSVGPQGAATDGRVIAAQIYSTQPTGTIGTTWATSTTTVFQNTSDDLTASYNPATGEFTLPISGRFRVTGQVSIQSTGNAAGQFAGMLIGLDGSQVTTQEAYARVQTATTVATMFVPFTFYIKGNAGQKLTLRAITNMTSPTFQSLSGGHFVSIDRLSGPTSGDEGRVLSSKATLSADSAAFTSAVIGKVPLNLAISDRGGMFDAVNQRFNISVPGDYFISMVIAWSTTTGLKLIGYKINGAGNYIYLADIPSADRPAGSGLIPNLKAGDYVEVYARQDSGSNAVIAGTESATSVSLFRLSGPNAVSAPESVNMAATTSGNTVTSAAAPIAFSTKLFDSHAAYSGATYTCVNSGKFEIAVYAITAAAAYATSTYFQVGVNKNGAPYKGLPAQYGNGATIVLCSGGSLLIDCKAGDTLQAYAVSAVSLTLGSDTNLSIKRVGN